MIVEEYCDRLSEIAEICTGHGGVNLPCDEVEKLVAVITAANEVVEQYLAGDLDADPELFAVEIKLRDTISSLVECFSATCEPRVIGKEN